MRRNSPKVPENSMSGKLPRPHEFCSCTERGKVGVAYWRKGKKVHTSRLRRRINDKVAISSSLEESECPSCGEPTTEEFCSEKCREEYEKQEQLADEAEYRHNVARGYIKPAKQND